jgi:hypothetical protein
MPFLPLLILLPAVLILISVGIATRRGGGVSNAMLTEPRCAKCNYDLRGFTGSVPKQCSECGADLTAPRAIVWGTFRPRKKWLIIGAVIAVTMPAVFLPLMLMHVRSAAIFPVPTAMFPGSPAFLARSNATVVAALSTTANQPWDWQELERRLDNGTLSNAEITAVIDKLIAYLNTQPANQPLSWCDSFLTKADSAGNISNTQYQRLARSFYKSTTVSIAASARSGQTVAVNVNGGVFWQLPGSQFVYALRDVSVNGKSLSLEHQGYRGQSKAGIQSELDYLSAVGPQQIAGRLKLDLPAGDYVLNVTVDVAVLHDKTAPQLGGNFPGQAGGWPLGRASWTESTSLPIKLVPAEQSPIALVTDSSLNPRSSVQVKSIRVIRHGSGQQATADVEIAGNKVACSFDLFLRIAGKLYPIGSLVAHTNGSTGTQAPCNLSSLDASVNTADVLLRPNPSRAEGVPGIDSVWGAEIDVLGVTLQRFDLPGK